MRKGENVLSKVLKDRSVASQRTLASVQRTARSKRRGSAADSWVATLGINQIHGDPTIIMGDYEQRQRYKVRPSAASSEFWNMNILNMNPERFERAVL